MRPLSPIVPRGVRLFVFGSAAAHWPDAPAGADLDLGYEIASPHPDRRAALRRELLQALDGLPTVRPVDTVDFAAASPEFRQTASAVTRALPDVHS
ncbi:MAG: nucleotidyltransferase domain-containing protein [Opitutae bacterium]|nr:nucleotidyltransferase domain-containing protein [Opitutae bacterium]